MKALSILKSGLSSGLLLTTALAVSTPVLADDTRYTRTQGLFENARVDLNIRFDDGVRRAGFRNVDYRDWRYSDRYDRYRDRRYDDRYDRRRDVRFGHRGPVTLQLDYNANGAGRVPLKRLLRDQYGIDSSEWRIRSVNVRNKSRYNACADLTVGGRSTGPVYLPRGTTTIAAPRGRSDGRWVLDFENAKVRDVAVTLVPRRGGDDRGQRKYRPFERDDDYAWRGVQRRGLSVR